MNKKIFHFLSSPSVQVISRFILGIVFIYASLDKIAHPLAFAKIIQNYKLLPDFFISFPAIVMPWVELISGLFLLVGVFKRAAAAILSLLLSIFSIAISINLIRGVNFDCGCFSTVSTASGSDPLGLLLRDILVLIPGLIILFFYQNKRIVKSESQISNSTEI